MVLGIYGWFWEGMYGLRKVSNGLGKVSYDLEMVLDGPR